MQWFNFVTKTQDLFSATSICIWLYHGCKMAACPPAIMTVSQAGGRKEGKKQKDLLWQA